MMHGNTRKGLVALACWLLAILLLAGCSGNSSEGDLVVPTVHFDGAGGVTTTRTRYLSGSVEAGATVEVMVGTEDIPADQVHVAGERWSCEIDNLQAGSNLITVTALDPAGNQNILNFYLTYDALSIERYVSPISGSAQTIGGLFDPTLASPQVQIGSGTPAAATVDGDQWSFDLAGLATGNNTVTVTVTHPDLGEVTRTLTINVNFQAPLITIDPAGTTPTVAGSRTLGGSWTGDSDPVVSVPTATVGTVAADAGAQTWSVDLTGLGAGKNAVAVSATASGVTATAHTLINQQIFTLRTPYAGQYDVDPGTAVSVTFSEDMTFPLPAGSFILSDGVNTVPATVTDDSARTATLTPATALAAGTDYTVTLTTDITNLSGEPLAHGLSWGFTTAP
jgi:Bacterial Ig-like domain